MVQRAPSSVERQPYRVSDALALGVRRQRRWLSARRRGGGGPDGLCVGEQAPWRARAGRVPETRDICSARDVATATAIALLLLLLLLLLTVQWDNGKNGSAKASSPLCCCIQGLSHHGGAGGGGS